MERYIGLDVHAASTTLVVISQSGKRVHRAVVETNGRALVEAIRMIPGNKCASKRGPRARGCTRY